MEQYWFKQEFIQEKIKIHWMVMGSSTRILLIGGELIYMQLKKHKCMVDEAISIMWLRQRLSLIIQS